MKDENTVSSGKELKSESLKQIMENTMKEKFDIIAKESQEILEELKSENLKQMMMQ